MSRGRPTSTPASIIASARRNTYAGPEPDSPVTASSCCSGTPHDDADRAEHPLGELEIGLGGVRAGRDRGRRRRRTSAGVLGMARTTGRAGARGLELGDA